MESSKRKLTPEIRDEIARALEEMEIVDAGPEEEPETIDLSPSDAMWFIAYKTMQKEPPQEGS